MKWFDKFYKKKISATGLAVFRIAYFTNFFFEVLFIFNKRHFFFDTIPYLEPFELDFTMPLFLWLIIIFGIIIGFYTRFLLIINYLFILVFIASLSTFEYHMDYIYTGVCFVVMFIPLSNCLSIDMVVNKLKDKKVSQLYYFTIIFIGIGLVYFDSVLHKFTSQLWINGLGVWLPASVPQMTILNDQWLLNQRVLMLVLGYVTLIFETVFVFLFWIKKTRILFVIIGFGLHLGILFEFPIPHFAFGMLSLYLLLIPVSVWDRLFSMLDDNLKYKVNKIIIELFSSFPKVKIEDYSNKNIIKCILIIFVCFQINAGFTTSLIDPVKRKLYSGLEQIHLKKVFDECHLAILKFSKNTFGITRHGVFIDNHFEGYNHIVAITYSDKVNEIWLPFIDERGMASSFCTGSVWAYLGFRVNSAKIEPISFKNGVKRYTAFWAHENGIDLNNAEFKIKVKKIDLPNWKWEKDYLSKQIAKPWQDAGILKWKDEKFELSLVKPIESF